MANLNKVFLIGRLTRDPELRYTPGGMGVAEFGLAVNRAYTAANGEKKEETCFVDISVWGRRGEVVKEHLRKGSPVFIEGRLDFRSWEAQDGSKRSRLRVVAENFQFLGAAPKRDEALPDEPLDPADFGFGPEARAPDTRTPESRPPGSSAGEPQDEVGEASARDDMPF
ncbi:MAG: single-stranded DNA-binding protein [Planctomycetota bacterium]